MLKEAPKTDTGASQVFAVAHTTLGEGRGNGYSRNDKNDPLLFHPKQREMTPLPSFFRWENLVSSLSYTGLNHMYL